MADSCIVCLGDFGALDDGPPPPIEPSPPPADSLGGADSDRHPGSPKTVAAPVSETTPHPDDDDERIARVLPCGHNFHNGCLKPWVQRANSCPICRASFNMVELSAHVGGTVVTSYAVADKQQVAEIDPTMIPPAEDYDSEDDDSYAACMVCEEFGDSTQLMYCNSCNALCHVFCAGLDDMPRTGPWYCQICTENPEALGRAIRRSTALGPAAYPPGGRNRRARATQDGWFDVWHSINSRLPFNVDNPYSETHDDDQSDNASEVQRRMNQEWDRRFALANRMGQGAHFRAAGSAITRPNPTLFRQPSPQRSPEAQEEMSAWNMFDKARDQLAGLDTRSIASNASSRRGRKRKSTRSSPARSDRPEPEPERKLKRPRTRLTLDGATRRGESSSAAPSRPEQLKTPPAASDTGPARGVLQKLLDDIGKHPKTEHNLEIAAPQPRRIIRDRALSPHGSPGLSPVYLSNTTPPPDNLATLNPQFIAPQCPDDGNHQSPTYSPYSPADEDKRNGRRKQSASPGLHSPPRSKDSSPNRLGLSLSTKTELQRMVTKVLKPFYHKEEITRAEYTDINRDVSHLLYERVGDAGAAALASSKTREMWQNMANDEVEKTVKTLRINNPLPLVDDSASSSS